jgi:hypothetical protein
MPALPLLRALATAALDPSAASTAGVSADAGAEGAGKGASETTGGSPLSRLLLMPDLSAIVRAGVAYDTLDTRSLSPRPGPTSPAGRPEFFLQEVELALQAVVDPYARADVFVSIGPEGANVEEAYLSATSLPGGLLVRAGELFAPFGRMNQQHPHVWEFVDAPLAQGRLLADEKLSGPGVDVAWLAPLPWFAELHVAGQSTAGLPGETPPADGSAPGPRLTGTARLLQYVSVSESTTVGVGLSAALREETGSGAFRDLGGVDVYLRHRPPASRAVTTLQGEWYVRRLRGMPGAGTDTGGWAQVLHRPSPFYGFGVRYEQAPSAAEDAPGTERRLGGVLAYLPSEFQRLRLQLSWDRLPDGRDGFEAILHVEFGIGAHGAHPF